MSYAIKKRIMDKNLIEINRIITNVLICDDIEQIYKNINMFYVISKKYNDEDKNYHINNINNNSICNYDEYIYYKYNYDISNVNSYNSKNWNNVHIIENNVLNSQKIDNSVYISSQTVEGVTLF